MGGHSSGGPSRAVRLAFPLRMAPAILLESLLKRKAWLGCGHSTRQAPVLCLSGSPVQCLRALYILGFPRLIYLYQPDCTGQPHSDANTEAQRGEVTCSRSHSQNSNPRLSNSISAWALSCFAVKPPEDHRRWSGQICACHMAWCPQEVPGSFHRRARVTYQSFLETVGAFRRWQRVLSSLAMRTLLTWPLG